MKRATALRTLAFAGMAFAAMAANAGLWEGLTDENHICGPKLTDRDLLGKVVMIFYYSDDEMVDKQLDRIERIHKSYDRNRFAVVGSSVGLEKDKVVAALARKKVTFPFYKGFKLASDKEKRHSGTTVAVTQFGTIERSSVNGQAWQDFEQYLVEAVTKVGLPPDLIPGVELVKYKGLKTKIKLGSNLKGVIKSLEKDVAAGEKKTANAQVKAKAEEASSILSAIKDGKSEIYDNITALAEANPEEAYRLLALYVKSFPDEAADNKEKLAELKVKAAEFKKSAPKKK